MREVVDTNVIFKELHNPLKWSLGSIIGDLSNFKQLCVEAPFDEPEDPREREMDLDDIEELEVVPIVNDNDNDEDDEEDDNEKKKKGKKKDNNLLIRFLDAKNFVTSMKLSKFVTTFTDEAPTPDDEKGVFPYKFIQSNNYMEILSKTDPFPQYAFNNMMDKSKMSNADYAKFLNDWDELKNKLMLERMCGWDYLKYYNIRDTQIMIKPIFFLINVWKKFNINMLNFITLASCAQAIKYMMLYEDMRMDQ
jgi:hypothetical protein